MYEEDYYTDDSSDSGGSSGGFWNIIDKLAGTASNVIGAVNGPKNTATQVQGQTAVAQSNSKTVMYVIGGVVLLVVVLVVFMFKRK